MFDKTTLFGDVAELCLLYIANYGSGHARGIASTFGVSPNAAQRQLFKFEQAGILVARMIGSTKSYEFNPRLSYRKELQALLEKILMEISAEDTEKYFRERRRPRRTGKAL